MGYYVKKRDMGLVISDKARPTTPETGLLRYNTTTNALEYYNGSVYVELAKTGSTNPVFDTYTGDAITVTFINMSYAPDSASSVLVFVDGIQQDPVTHYTVSGTSITFTSAPPSGSGVTIIHNLARTYVVDGDVYDVPNL